MASPLLSALRNRRFLTLWAGQCVSALGDRFTQVALLSLVIAGNAARAQAEISFYDYLPWLLFGPFAGVLVDRCSRKGLMIAADLARAALVGALFAFGLGQGADLSRAYPLLFGMGLMTAVFSPAKSAALPDLVGPDQILPSGALLSATGVIATALGGILAGWVIDHWSYRACLLFDAASFLVSAGAVALIAFPRTVPKAPLTLSTAVRDLGEGFRELARNAELRTIAAFLFVFWFIATGVQVVSLNFGKEVLGLGEGHMTALNQMLAAAGLGLLAGAGVTAAFGHRVPRRAAYLFASAGMSAAIFALAASTGMGAALAFLFLTGTAGGSLVSRIDADVLKAIRPELRGRVFGANSVLFAAAVLAPLKPLGWLSARMAAADILRLLALVLAGLAVIVLLRLVRDRKSGMP